MSGSTLSPIDKSILDLTRAWYAFAGLDHHKDRDCHFYIEEVWSYGDPPKFRPAHYGYIHEMDAPVFDTYDGAKQELYKRLDDMCKDHNVFVRSDCCKAAFQEGLCGACEKPCQSISFTPPPYEPDNGGTDGRK